MIMTSRELLSRQINKRFKNSFTISLKSAVGHLCIQEHNIVRLETALNGFSYMFRGKLDYFIHPTTYFKDDKLKQRLIGGFNWWMDNALYVNSAYSVRSAQVLNIAQYRLIISHSV